jgi:glycosyltransferase involved in cell wall biosynthesis
VAACAKHDKEFDGMIDPTAPETPVFSLVLPAYNPGAMAERSLRELQAFVDRQPRSWELIFVCDGCTDGSDVRLAELAGQCAQSVRVLRSARNRGKGYAVRLGLLAARGQYRIFTDVDLAYRLDMVESVAEQLLAGDDMVIASRSHPESEIVMAPGMENYLKKRKLQSVVFSNVARTLLGIRQRDPQAGLKGLSARAAVTVLPYVKCPGFGFDCELIVACKYFGIPIREVPIRVHYDHVVSTTRATTGLKMIGELWRIRKHWQKIRRDGPDYNILTSVSAGNIAALRRGRKRRRSLP